YIRAQSDIEPEPKEDTKILESYLERAIKMMSITPEEKEPVQPVINLTVPRDNMEKADIVKALADAVKEITLEPAVITVTNEVNPTPVTIENEVVAGEVVVNVPEQPPAKVDVNVNIEQVDTMHTEYNRDKNGQIISADTEVENDG
ncbi:MAG: hypothetical protein GY727_03960, partial [Gammaproteobacteria bacterium]|nr:hypothetical protein [Gammaproteobacteria bacterium]